MLAEEIAQTAERRRKGLASVLRRLRRASEKRFRQAQLRRQRSSQPVQNDNAVRFRRAAHCAAHDLDSIQSRRPWKPNRLTEADSLLRTTDSPDARESHPRAEKARRDLPQRAEWSRFPGSPGRSAVPANAIPLRTAAAARRLAVLPASAVEICSAHKCVRFLQSCSAALCWAS